MNKGHQYKIQTVWRSENGTTDYKGYDRDHEIKAEGKPIILSSSDPSFRGNPAKYNPEELFISSISSCHMLWYLHLCAVNNIIVLEYKDCAEGIMNEREDGSGQFTEVVLNPHVLVAAKKMMEHAGQLHEVANKYCFIANSINFKVKHKPTIEYKKN